MKQGKGNRESRERMKSSGATGALIPLAAQVKACLSSFKNPALWAGLFGVVAFVLSMAISGPAIAGPDKVEIIDSTAIASGDQSDGVASGVDFSTPDVFTVNVLNLIKDITPDEGVAGIKLEDQGAPGRDGAPVIGQPGGDGGPGHGDLTVNFTGEDHGIATEGDDAMGIVVQSSGGRGGHGGSALVGSGGTGGHGGNSGSVTITSDSTITTSGNNAYGIAARSTGGRGGDGGTTRAVGFGGTGGHGGNSGSVTITSDSTITTSGNNAYGIAAQSSGGDGGNGGWITAAGDGGRGGDGGNSGSVTITSDNAITTTGNNAYGIAAHAFGGRGGDGGTLQAAGSGGRGGDGGNSGSVTITSDSTITTTGNNAYGIAAHAFGGRGGDGGHGADGLLGQGGHGGTGGDSGSVTIESSGTITTSGSKANGILVFSQGGDGGDGGHGAGLVAASAGQGGAGGDSGSVTVTSDRAITTTGEGANAIFAATQGGAGGKGGDGSSNVASVGGDGGTGGDSGSVTVISDSTITTSGDKAQGIAAQSLGGAGGAGGMGMGAIGRGGATQGGGDGGVVGVANTGAIETSGEESRGIIAQSVGGYARDSGMSIGFIAFGAGDESGGDGGAVTVDNSGLIRTRGLNSSAIIAQSVGGGGGAGSGSAGIFSFGGKGNAGGNASGVRVTNTGGLRTSGANASAIIAQSVGGGGGTGGFAVSAGAFLSLAMGGAGGKGGDGAGVLVDSGQADIVTEGDRSSGIHAQSIGGGGGTGGFAVSVAAGKYVSATLALGGNGGDGGSGGTVSVESDSVIKTSGDDAHGILAQSVGGGGGTGGFSIAASAVYEGWSGALSWGGTGGDGGDGESVIVDSTGDITTQGFHSYGIIAQSVGGGGGTGGFSIAGSISYGAAMGVSLGGFGGGGGDGRHVTVNSAGNILTYGEQSHGILAQSVGGGGGNGGFSVAAAGANEGTGISFSLGGFAGKGGDGGDVTVLNLGSIGTARKSSYGILAQSVGGGGGSGGFAGSIAGCLKDGTNLAFSLGGFGGDGGHGGTVTLDNRGAITTLGAASHGILAQSVGGGGGDGGFGLAAVMGGGEQAVNLSLAMGGWGGTAGHSAGVEVDNAGSIETFGEKSYGILAQSIGGGGGSGGFSAAGSLSWESNMPQLSVSIGGFGGGGGDGGPVAVNSTGTIVTHGEGSVGIQGQSIGGGGGNGGVSFAGAFSGQEAKNITVSIGGSGGQGGNAGTVDITSEDTVATLGNDAHAILAQSIGGGGGNGGLSIAGEVHVNGKETVNLGISIGGQGGTGGSGGDVNVRNEGLLVTHGDESHGIFAQSIGGGGGAGGGSMAVAATIKTKNALNLSVSVGGKGGDGNHGGDLVINNDGEIHTLGGGSHGIFAQSIGGGGGAGGSARAMTVAKSSEESKSLSLSIGGEGGGTSHGGSVSVNNTGSITTQAGEAYGIFAQSIGGGGGVGGNANQGSGLPIAEPEASDKDKKKDKNGIFNNLTISIGGAAGAAGDGGAISVMNSGDIVTLGDNSSAILAQSIGGGGGHGGNGIVGKEGTLSIGGTGGAAGQGGAVEVANSGNITTSGVTAFGIRAKSIGGGGGAAGNTEMGEKGKLTIGGTGGAAGDGGTVKVTNSGSIVTSGDGGLAIFAHSIGGGGGTGGSINPPKEETLLSGSGPDLSFSLAIGGAAGAAGHGGSVSVDNTGSIITQGNKAYGIFAQSIGGGGGVGGNANQGKSKSLLAAESTEDLSGISINLTVSLGGSSGSSGNGGTVSITNSGDIETLGDGSYGIFAQSVGGGGGHGGNGAIATGGILSLGGSGGGSGGAAGDGAAVKVANSGKITTLGDTAFGILAQSVGGGGGAAANVDMGKGLIAIGGEGGAGGNGDTVEVTNSGSIVTSGDGSSAIFAQSVGGGGGVAGDVKRGSNTFGINVAIGRSGGNGGDGGRVTVTNTSDIFTAGTGAHGIFAQSVGGGGGVVGNLGQGIQFAGSVGAVGSGSDVKVIQTGNITTAGDGSQGILAQSAGGKGTGGKVDITVTGNITASGADSHAILAQSRGDSGAGNISISITNGLVEGGTGEGAGVRFIEGDSNTLTNHGMIVSANRMAIIGSTGNETIDNFGVIAGSVDLGGGMNAFNNHPGGLFLPGSTLKLGPGCTFTNAGFFTPGSTADGEATVLGSDFLQTGTGVYQVWVTRDGNTSQMRVNGTAKLGGTIEVVRGMGPFYDGTTFNVLEATTLENSFSQEIMPNTPLLTFTTNYFRDSAQPDVVQVATQARSFTTVATNRVEYIQGLYLDRVLREATGDFSFVLGEFQALSMPEFHDAFTSLSPNIYDADTLTTDDVTRQYIGTLRQRLRTLRQDLASGKGGPRAQKSFDYNRSVLLASNGPDRTLGQLLSGSESARQGRLGLWIEGFGQFGNQKTSHGFGGFDYTTGGGTLGVDYALTERLVTGASFGYSRASIDLDDDFGSGTVKSFFGSLYGTYFAERAYLDGTLSYGKHEYDNRRKIRIGSIQRTAESDHDGNSFSLSAETGYRFSFRKFILQPFASLLYTRLHDGSLEESGADSLNMRVDSRWINSLISELGLTLTRHFAISRGILAPEIRAAWLHDFDVDDRTMAVSFTGAPSGFTLDGRSQDRNGALVGVGLTLIDKDGFITASVRYDGEFRSSYDAHGISGQIRFSF